MNKIEPLEVDAPVIIKTEYEQGMTIRQRWWAFHRQNPDVYLALRNLAFGLKRKGFKKGSISLIYERLRWEVYIQTQGDDFKLNNSYRALYARLLMRREKELEGFFYIRKRRSE